VEPSRALAYHKFTVASQRLGVIDFNARAAEKLHRERQKGLSPLQGFENLEKVLARHAGILPLPS
jgi:hypothetical protein